MKSTVVNNIPKIAAGIRVVIKETLDNAAFRIPKAISDACPHVGMKGYFGGKVYPIPDGWAMDIYTTYPKPISVYVTEFGRAGYIGSKTGRPLYIPTKAPVKTRAGIPETPGPKELQKYLDEGYIVRKGMIAPSPARPFIRPVWEIEYIKLKTDLTERIFRIVEEYS